MTPAPRKSNDIAHHLQLPVILNRGYRDTLPAEWATQKQHTLVAIPSRVVDNCYSRQGSSQENPVNLREHSRIAACGQSPGRAAEKLLDLGFGRLSVDPTPVVDLLPHLQRRDRSQLHHGLPVMRAAEGKRCSRPARPCSQHGRNLLDDHRLSFRRGSILPGHFRSTTLEPTSSEGSAPGFAPSFQFRLTNHPVLPPAHLNHERVIRCANYLRPCAERLPKATEHSCGLTNKCSVTCFPTSHQGFGRTTQLPMSQLRPAVASVLSNTTSRASAIGPAMHSPRSSVRSSPATRCEMFASRLVHSHLLAKESALRFNSSLPAK
jgi:hypothetical protein